MSHPIPANHWRRWPGRSLWALALVLPLTAVLLLLLFPPANAAAAVTVQANGTITYTATRITSAHELTISSPTFAPPTGFTLAKLSTGNYAQLTNPAPDGAMPMFSPNGSAGVGVSVIIASVRAGQGFLLNVNGLLAGGHGKGQGGGQITWAAKEKRPTCAQLAAQYHAKTIKVAVPKEIDAVTHKIAKLLKKILPFLKGKPTADVEGEVEAKFYKACCCPKSCDKPVNAYEYGGSAAVTIGAGVRDGFSRGLGYSSKNSVIPFSVHFRLILGPSIHVLNVAKIGVSGEQIGTAADAAKKCADGPSECGSCLVFTGSDGIKVKVDAKVLASGRAMVFQPGHFYSVNLHAKIHADAEGTAPGSISLKYYAGTKCHKHGFQHVQASFGPLILRVTAGFVAAHTHFDAGFEWELTGKHGIP